MDENKTGIEWKKERKKGKGGGNAGKICILCIVKRGKISFSKGNLGREIWF
jgi:hypothetical protein